jgi:phosphate transport system substrate-binding protein
VYRDQTNEAKGKALVKFLWWATHDGQKYAGTLLYAPLPAPVVKQIEATVW